MSVRHRNAARLFGILLASAMAIATAFPQSEYPASASFAPPPRPALSEDNALPGTWPYGRPLESGSAIGGPARWRVDIQYGTPSHPIDLNAPATEVFQPGETEWWKMFRDPELDRLEDLALAANQDLRIAITHVIQSRFQARIVAADFFPHFDLAGQYSRSVSSDDGPVIRTSNFPVDDSPAVNSLIRTFTQNDYEAKVQFSWEVDVFGRIRAAYAAGQARTQASLADARGVRLSVTADLATGYFALRDADEQIAILDDTVALRRESLSLNRARTGVGIGLPDDVARASLELDTAEAQLANAQRERNELESNLALLCAQPAPDFHVSIRPLHTITPPALPQDIPAALLTRRPDVEAAERRLAAAIQDVREARAEELPRVTLTGDIGHASESFDRFANYSSHEATIMPVISLPLFEGGRLEASARLAVARRDEAAADYKEAVLTAFREASTDIDDMRQRAIQYAALGHAVQDAQLVLDYSNTRFSKHTVSYFQVVTDEASLLDAQLQAAVVLYARFDAAISLARALGGGWSDVPAVPATRGQSARSPSR